jgi:hypothetical protein
VRRVYTSPKRQRGNDITPATSRSSRMAFPGRLHFLVLAPAQGGSPATGQWAAAGALHCIVAPSPNTLHCSATTCIAVQRMQRCNDRTSLSPDTPELSSGHFLARRPSRNAHSAGAPRPFCHPATSARGLAILPWRNKWLVQRQIRFESSPLRPTGRGERRRFFVPSCPSLTPQGSRRPNGKGALLLSPVQRGRGYHPDG